MRPHRSTLLAAVTAASLTALSTTAAAQRGGFVDWSATATEFRGQVGRPITVQCAPGGPVRSVWGTDVYSDDSSICAAAMHAGRIGPGGGPVTFFVQPGQPAYVGSARNGVVSQSYGGYAGSFSFTPGARGPAQGPGLAVAVPVAPAAPMPPAGAMGAVAMPPAAPMPMRPPTTGWNASGTEFRGQVGAAHTLFCPPGGTFGSVWGTDVYTDDSSICTAAVHAGVLRPGGGGQVTYYTAPGLPAYQGSPRNGVQSANYGAYTGSITFRPPGRGGFAPPPPPPPPPPPNMVGPGVGPGFGPGGRGPRGAMPITWQQNAQQWRGQNGARVRLFCPPGGSPGSLWGDRVYTDDSSICTAAMHMGRIGPGGGPVTITIMPGMPGYRGRPANGVVSQPYPAYSGSFRVQ